MTLAGLLILSITIVAPAHAVDQPVFGQRIIVKRNQSGKEKLVVLLKDPVLLFPAIGGTDDPSSVSMLVELFPGNGGATSSFTMPAGLGKPGWQAKTTGKGGLYKFKNADAPDGISEVRVGLIREGRLLKIVAKRTGLALAAPQGSVGVRVTTGTLRHCALFAGETIQRDEVGQFKARKAPPPIGCEDATLLDLPPVCGDGIVNGAEVCDGPGSCESPLGFFDCRVAGASGECSCCSNSCPSLGGGCCQPSILIPQLGSCGGFCIPNSCTPPYSCGGGAECLPDETCCASAGNFCHHVLLGMDGLPCCAGASCVKSAAGGFALTCCLPDGSACASNAECCSDACGVSGTCDPCLSNGTACTDPDRCCSQTCGSSGTCECATAGVPCASSGACCSGSCDPSTNRCDP